MVKKTIIFFFVLLFAMYMPAAAQELPENYTDFADSIPEDVAELLPEGLFSSNSKDIETAVNEMTSWEYIWDFIFNLIGLNLKEAIKVFAHLTGLLVLCSLLSMLKNSIKNDGISALLPMVGSVVIVSAILVISKEPLERIELFFDEIGVFTNSMTPVICSMYAMGGNVSAAIVNNYGMLMFLSILENICLISFKIIVGVCMSLATASAFLPNINLKPMISAIKRVFTFFVGFAMLIFSAVLSSQTLLAAKSDSLGSQAMKMFAGQMIPLVGTTVGDSLKTAGASVEYLRSTVGIGIIIIYILMVIPTILSVWGFRLSFIASNAISGLLGCEKEGYVISEMASIYGYILAIASVCSIALLLIITIFAKCSSALSG